MVCICCQSDILQKVDPIIVFPEMLDEFGNLLVYTIRADVYAKLEKRMDKLGLVLQKYIVSEPDKQFFINPEIVTDEKFDSLMFVADKLRNFINVIEMKLRVEKDEDRYVFCIEVAVDLPFSEYILCWEKFIDFCYNNEMKIHDLIIDFAEVKNG